MKKIARFEKVSYEQFKSCFDLNDDIVSTYYDNIILPQRATIGSAGYDIATPVDVFLKPGESIIIPTGIRCEMYLGWVLKVYPRSGLGFKYRLRINNTVGIIDADYYYSDNEGHIMLKLSNEGDKDVALIAGDRVAQGIFVEYGITEDDNATGVRNGGFGSTSK